jgi:hypothetical protein
MEPNTLFRELFKNAEARLGTTTMDSAYVLRRSKRAKALRFNGSGCAVGVGAAPRSRILAIESSPDHRRGAHVSTDGELAIWAFHANGDSVQEGAYRLDMVGAPTLGLAWIGNDAVITTDATGGVWYADVAHQGEPAREARRLDTPALAAYAPNADDLVFVHCNGGVTFLPSLDDVGRGTGIASPAPATSRLCSLSDGRLLCYPGEQGELVMIDRLTRKVGAKWVLDSPVVIAGASSEAVVLVARDGGRVIVVSSDLRQQWSLGALDMDILAAAVQGPATAPRMLVIDRNRALRSLSRDTGCWRLVGTSQLTNAHSLTPIDMARVTHVVNEDDRRRVGELVELIRAGGSETELERAHAELVERGHERASLQLRVETARAANDVSEEYLTLQRLVLAIDDEPDLVPRLTACAERLTDLRAHASAWKVWERVRARTPSITVPRDAERLGRLAGEGRVVVERGAASLLEPDAPWHLIDEVPLARLVHATLSPELLRRVVGQAEIRLMDDPANPNSEFMRVDPCGERVQRGVFLNASNQHFLLSWESESETSTCSLLALAKAPSDGLARGRVVGMDDIIYKLRRALFQAENRSTAHAHYGASVTDKSEARR